MTMKVTAVHSVTLKSGQKPIRPGQVFELEDRDAKDLVARKAVRRPTEEELAAYDAANPADDGKGGKAATPTK